MATPIYKTPKKNVNVREVSTICTVRNYNVEREIKHTVTVTDASRENVLAEVKKLITGVLLDFRISRISAVNG